MTIDTFAHITPKNIGNFVSQIVDEMSAQRDQISKEVLSKIQYYRELVELLGERDTSERREYRREICEALSSARIITGKVGNILSNDNASFLTFIQLLGDTNQSKEF